MGIEYKYDYIYYTVINIEHWRRGNEDIFGNEFCLERVNQFINNKFETSEDKIVNDFKVEDSWYIDDIDSWLQANYRNKVRPIFIQFQENQRIIKSGGGCIFELYEHDDDYEEYYSDDDFYNQD